MNKNCKGLDSCNQVKMEYKDKSRRRIMLTNERIKHIYHHPEMQNKLHLIEGTIRKPDWVEEDLYRKDILYYYSYIKEERKHIMVVVRVNNRHGYIKTAYMVKR